MKKMFVLSVALLLVSGVVQAGSKSFINTSGQDVNVTLVSIADKQPAETITIAIKQGAAGTINYKSANAASVVVRDMSGKTLLSLAACASNDKKCKEVLNNCTKFTIKKDGKTIKYACRN